MMPQSRRRAGSRRPRPQPPSKPAAQPAPRRRRRGACSSLAPAARGGLPPIDEASFGAAHASPSVRKSARELGVESRQRARQRREGPHPARRRQGLRQAGDVRAVAAVARRRPRCPRRTTTIRPRSAQVESQTAQPRAEDLRPAAAGARGSTSRTSRSSTSRTSPSSKQLRGTLKEQGRRPRA